MKRIMLSSLVTSALLAPLFLLMAGCEEGDLTGEVFRVEPSQVTLMEVDTTVVLQAVGGEEPFTWTVSDGSLGSVTGSVRTVTYTRTAKNGANTVQVTDNRQWMASALVIQAKEAVDLAITPANASLSTNGLQAVFTAAGGVQPYVWSCGNDSGKIYSTGPNQAVYTRVNSGPNTVIVFDDVGHVALVNVSQP